MKLIRADNEMFVFHLDRREKDLLAEVLRRYPLVPASSDRHRMSIQAVLNAEPQRLLELALAAQREEHQRQVRAMLNEPGRFKEADAGFDLILSPANMEWLLQVLNDVRVGSWIALGSPNTEKGDAIALNARNAPHVWLMETAGYFEMQLLEAMGEKPF